MPKKKKIDAKALIKMMYGILAWRHNPLTNFLGKFYVKIAQNFDCGLACPRSGYDCLPSFS
jgi:hypothetical protein